MTRRKLTRLFSTLVGHAQPLYRGLFGDEGLARKTGVLRGVHVDDWLVVLVEGGQHGRVIEGPPERFVQGCDNARVHALGATHAER